MKIVINSIRVIVGVLFIFSGLVKANDPAGLSYKMHEFFEAWSTTQFNSWALTLSVLMIAFEIIAGIALLLGWQKKWTLWLLLMLILFFTFLTGYAWLSGKFKACGCFGDCIPIKPNQSFYKDVILLVLIVILLIFQKYIQPLFKNRVVLWSILGVGVIFSFLIQKYTLDHLPIKDCLSFKVGNNILEKKQFIADSVQITYFYNKDRKEYSYSPPNYPQWILDEDSTYVQDTAKTVTKVLKEGNKGDMILDFNLTNENDADTTEALLSQQGKILLLLITDIEENMKYKWEDKFRYLSETTFISSDTAKQKGLLALYDTFAGKKYPLYIVTNKAADARLFFGKKFGIASNHIMFCDEKPLLAAARTRPALLLLQQGKILEKRTLLDVYKLKL